MNKLIATGIIAGLTMLTISSVIIRKGPVSNPDYAVGLACRRAQQWKCALSPKDAHLLARYNMKYRLAAYDETGSLKAATDINDTRDQTPETNFILFTAQSGPTYMCKLEVYSENNTIVRECGLVAGRLRCLTGQESQQSSANNSATANQNQYGCANSSGDINRDGNVDLGDVNLFGFTTIGRLRGDYKGHVDLNCDGAVNEFDWGILFQRVLGNNSS